MNLYLIVLNEPNPELWENLERDWGSPYQTILSDTAAIVGAPSRITNPDKVCERLGMSDEKKVEGIVVQMTRYQGYLDEAVWDWVDEIQKAQ